MITRPEIGKSANQFAGQWICRYRYDDVLDDAVDIEKIDELFGTAELFWSKIVS